MQARNQPKPHYICQITLLIMREPVIASDGNHYEKEAIEAHFARSNLSPLDGLPLQPHFFPDHALRNEIDAFLMADADYWFKEKADDVYLPRDYWSKLYKAIFENDLTTVKLISAKDPRLLTQKAADFGYANPVGDGQFTAMELANRFHVFSIINFLNREQNNVRTIVKVGEHKEPVHARKNKRRHKKHAAYPEAAPGGPVIPVIEEAHAAPILPAQNQLARPQNRFALNRLRVIFLFLTAAFAAVAGIIFISRNGRVQESAKTNSTDLIEGNNVTSALTANSSTTSTLIQSLSLEQEFNLSVDENSSLEVEEPVLNANEIAKEALNKIMSKPLHIMGVYDEIQDVIDKLNSLYKPLTSDSLMLFQKILEIHPALIESIQENILLTEKHRALLLAVVNVAQHNFMLMNYLHSDAELNKVSLYDTINQYRSFMVQGKASEDEINEFNKFVFLQQITAIQLNNRLGAELLSTIEAGGKPQERLMAAKQIFTNTMKHIYQLNSPVAHPLAAVNSLNFFFATEMDFSSGRRQRVSLTYENSMYFMNAAVSYSNAIQISQHIIMPLMPHDFHHQLSEAFKRNKIPLKKFHPKGGNLGSWANLEKLMSPAVENKRTQFKP